MSYSPFMLPGNVRGVLFETVSHELCVKAGRVGYVRSVYVYFLEAAKLPCVLIAVFLLLQQCSCAVLCERRADRGH